MAKFALYFIHYLTEYQGVKLLKRTQKNENMKLDTLA